MTNEGTRIGAIAMIKDGYPGIEHYPVLGNVYSDVLSFIAASKTFHTPTLQVANQSNSDVDSYILSKTINSTPI